MRVQSDKWRWLVWPNSSSKRGGCWLHKMNGPEEISQLLVLSDNMGGGAGGFF